MPTVIRNAVRCPVEMNRPPARRRSRTIRAAIQRPFRGTGLDAAGMEASMAVGRVLTGMALLAALAAPPAFAEQSQRRERSDRGAQRTGERSDGQRARGRESVADRSGNVERQNDSDRRRDAQRQYDSQRAADVRRQVEIQRQYDARRYDSRNALRAAGLFEPGPLRFTHGHRAADHQAEHRDGRAVPSVRVSAQDWHRRLLRIRRLSVRLHAARLRRFDFRPGVWRAADHRRSARSPGLRRRLLRRHRRRLRRRVPALESRGGPSPHRSAGLPGSADAIEFDVAIEPGRTMTFRADW